MDKTKPLVLVVDDEMDTRVFLYSLLDSAGYRVATCTQGLEALDYVAQNRPDLVVSDVRMPEIEGLEVLAKVKYMSPETRVLLITAFPEAGLRREALEAGGEDVLYKPFTNEAFLASVARALERVEP